MTDLRVISFTPKPKPPEPDSKSDNAYVIEALEELLEEAKQGKLCGFISIVDNGDETFGYLRTGNAGVGHLTHAIGMVTAYQHDLCSKLR